MGNDRNDDPRRWPDGVETYPADLSSYDTARQQLAQFQTPQLGSPPNGRVFVACFDGTWNDKDQDAVDTNVAEIYDQIFDARRNDVKAGYQPGVGTQESEFAKNVDGALGYSYGPRMEKMYYDFIRQARDWREENPNAEISIASVGFSRGGVTASMFTRMVHERGIQNPDGMVIERDRDGNIQSLTPTQPNLVPPGKTPQVVGLFDPVATGEMNLVDTRLPPSVVSGFQITALDERRDLFLSKQIIDPGLSADGRFLAVQVAGAHSDLGGGYRLNGLPVRNGNMMMAYLNGTFGETVLRERAVPTAPEMNVIHRSEQGASLYKTYLHDLADGRVATERLAEPARTPVGMVYDHLTKNMYDAEPVDRQLQGSLRYRPVPVGPQREDPTLPDFFKDRPQPEAPQTVRSAPLPGVGAPFEDRPPTPAIDPDPYRDIQRDIQQRFQPVADDIPTLDTVTVRPGPELTPAARNNQTAPTVGDDRPRGNEIPIGPPPGAAAQPAALRIGAQGPMVLAMQQGLSQMRATDRAGNALQADGVFGERTREAIESFQAARHAPITGVADEAMQMAILQQAALVGVQRDLDRARGEERDFAAYASFTPPPLPDAVTQALATPVQPPAAQAVTEPYTPPDFGPPETTHLTAFAHPAHPIHRRYAIFREGLQQAHDGELPGARLDQYSDRQLDQLAAKFTEQLGASPHFGTEIKGFRLSEDGQLSVWDQRPSFHLPTRQLDIDTKQALARSPEQHAGIWRDREVPEAAPRQAHTPAQTQVSPNDPRHSQHPRHALFEQAREGIADAHTTWGRPMPEPEQLDRMAAGLTIALRKHRITEFDGVQMYFPNGPAAPAQYAVMNNGSPILHVDSRQLEQTPEMAQASQQLQAVDQRVAMQMQQEQAQREQAQGQGMGLSR